MYILSTADPTDKTATDIFPDEMIFLWNKLTQWSECSSIISTKNKCKRRNMDVFIRRDRLRVSILNENNVQIRNNFENVVKSVMTHSKRCCILILGGQ